MSFYSKNYIKFCYIKDLYNIKDSVVFIDELDNIKIDCENKIDGNRLKMIEMNEISELNNLIFVITANTYNSIAGNISVKEGNSVILMSDTIISCKNDGKFNINVEKSRTISNYEKIDIDPVIKGFLRKKRIEKLLSENV